MEKRLAICLLCAFFVLMATPLFSAPTKGGNEVSGKLVCATCELKKQGAVAQCDLYGHLHALRTKDGKIWSIIPNDSSKTLLRDESLVGKDVTVKGKSFPSAMQLDVAEYKIGSDWYSYCSTCKKIGKPHKH
ncbi:MAG: hypothetical protein HYU64_13230 [Armatimonadetes bacterium]|nr:hypothetical protein [Armatimonadota bacterium]